MSAGRTTLNLHQLRVFRAVSEELSVTRAARRLRISQPAVSKQLAELEQNVGARLVDRLPRGLRLTAAGALLAGHARRIFQAEEAATLELAELLGMQRGNLSVGASTTIGSYLVPLVLGEFHARYPKLRVELQIGNTKAVTEALSEGQIDVGLIEGPVHGEFEQLTLTHDEMVLIASASDPSVERRQISLGELARLPFIARERGSGTREVIEAALAAQGVSLDPAMSLGSTESVKNAVRQGLGVAMVSRLAVDLELESGHLCVVEVDGLRIRRPLRLVKLEGKHLAPGAIEFVRLLREHFTPAHLAPEGDRETAVTWPLRS